MDYKLFSGWSDPWLFKKAWIFSAVKLSLLKILEPQMNQPWLSRVWKARLTRGSKKFGSVQLYPHLGHQLFLFITSTWIWTWHHYKENGRHNRTLMKIQCGHMTAAAMGLWAPYPKHVIGPHTSVPWLRIRDLGISVLYQVAIEHIQTNYFINTNSWFEFFTIVTSLRHIFFRPRKPFNLLNA